MPLYTTAEGIGHTPSMIAPDEALAAPHSYGPDDFLESDPADPGTSIDESTTTSGRNLGTVKVDGPTIDECFSM